MDALISVNLVGLFITGMSSELFMLLMNSITGWSSARPRLMLKHQPVVANVYSFACLLLGLLGCH